MIILLYKINFNLQISKKGGYFIVDHNKNYIKITKKFFYSYMFFSNFLIFLPVLIIIYKYRGISIADMLLIESIYNIVITLFEVPTAIIGDKIGNDKSVIVGTIGTSLAFLIFAFCNTFLTIVIVQIMLGIFASCISGSDIASISKLESFYGERDEKLFSNIYAISTFSMLLSYILSGVIIKQDDSGLWIMLIEAFVTMLAVLFYILYCLHKKKIVCLDLVYFEERKEVIELNNTNDRLNHKLIETFICGLLLGILSIGYLVSQIFMNNLQIEDEYFGVFYCLLSIISIIFTRINSRMKVITVFLMPILFIIPCFNYPFMIFPFILLYGYLKAKVIPFVTEYISSRTEEHKARNLSISSMINNLINAIFMLVLSKLVYNFGFQFSMIILVLITSLLLIYIFKNKFLDKGII